MQQQLIFGALVLVAGVVANESKWIWEKNHRNHRAFDSSGVDKYGNNYYDRQKDREPTTRRPSTSRPSEEDLISPDDIRSYNGPLGYPPAMNNYPPGYAPPTGPSGAQIYPNPLPNAQGQPGYPTGPGGFGYPAPGGFQQPQVNPYQAQGPFPNQVPGQGFYPTGPYPAQQGVGYPPGFGGYPGFGPNGGFQGQGGYPGQNQITGPGGVPNLGGNPAAQGYPFYPFGPYPPAGGGFPNPQGIAGPQGFPNQVPNQQAIGGQQGFPSQPTAPGQQGFPSPYPQQQFPVGQYNNCLQFGFLLCPSPQQGQFPPQFAGAPQYPVGQFPVPNPNANPFGITPYNRGGGYAAAFDDYGEISKNSTVVSANRALKPEGKSFNTSTPTYKTTDAKGHKKT